MRIILNLSFVRAPWYAIPYRGVNQVGLYPNLTQPNPKNMVQVHIYENLSGFGF